MEPEPPPAAPPTAESQGQDVPPPLPERPEGEQASKPGSAEAPPPAAATPPPPPPRPFPFADGFDEGGFPSTWATAKATSEQETQCPPLINLSQEVQTDGGIDVAVQAEPPEPPQFIPVPEDQLPGLPEFLHRTELLVDAALQDTMQCHAFSHYDVSWDDERGDIALVSELPFRFVAQQSSSPSPDSLSRSHSSPSPQPGAGNALESVGLSDQDTPACCNGIAWNCTGALLSVAYGGSDHTGWCAHRGLVRVWSVFRGATTARGGSGSRSGAAAGGPLNIELGSCATAVAFHPQRPSVLAAGAFTGQLLVIDTDRSADPILVSSDINSEQSHREPVTAIAWITQAGPRSSSSSGAFAGSSLTCELATASNDGRVIVWSLSVPAGGAASLTAARSVAIGATTAREGSSIPGITCVAWIAAVGDTSQFLAGTEGGRLYKCSGDAALSVPAKQSASGGDGDEPPPSKSPAPQSASGTVAATILFNYEPHAGPVLSVSQSPMHRNVFLTTGADGAVRLYNALQARAMLTLVPSDQGPLCAEWSPSRPSVFGVGCADGRVYFYDLALENGHAHAAAVLKASTSECAIASVAFNRASREYFATADTDGNVRVWLLSTYLSEAEGTDAAAIERYGEISRGKRLRPSAASAPAEKGDGSQVTPPPKSMTPPPSGGNGKKSPAPPK